MMRKPTTALLLLIILYTILLALPTTLEKPHEQKTLLWEIQSRSGHTYGYLLGSIYFLKKDQFPLPEIIEKTFEQCDILVVETDLNSANNQLIAEQIFQKATFKGKDTLKDSISSENYEKAKTILLELGLQIEKLERLKPWMVGILIFNGKLEKLGLMPDGFIDKYFLDRVTKNSKNPELKKKEILELESLETKLKWFDGFTPEESEMFLVTNLLNVDLFEKEWTHLVDAMQTGNIKAIENIQEEGLRRFPQLKVIHQKIVINRTLRITEQLHRLLQQNKGKNMFVITGIDYTLGENGIIGILEKKGYKLIQR